jgi:hypothetical protein
VFKSGANWFFWIAGLSLINSIILLSGGQWNFIVGLGITQIIDSFGLAASGEAGGAGKIVVFIFDLMVAGVFILFGVLARKGYGGAFIVGMIVYALDGMLFLLVKDFLSIGFHIFIMFLIFSGYGAYKKLKSMGKVTPA